MSLLGVLTLLELLQSGGTRTMGELAGRLEVDPRTVRRYVGHLHDLGVPVESVRGRYGGYRLAAGFRLPPLMFTDDEALAVLLALAPATDAAGSTARAKLRRVLPEPLARRVDAVLDSTTFTAPARPKSIVDSDVLLSAADAVRHHRPLALRYVAADGRRSDRVLHPSGLVQHSGRWYVVGFDPGAGAERTLRLDRIADARVRPGSFTPPAGVDPAERVLTALATAPHRHDVTLHIHATADEVRARLPASVATLTADGEWLRAELRVESLDWLPGILATLDRPFVIERPDELRDRVAALAERLAASAFLAPRT